MIVYFSTAACLCGLLSSMAWFYASQIKFVSKNDFFKVNGQPIVDASDINNFMKKSGRANAGAAALTGLASMFSALSIFCDKL